MIFLQIYFYALILATFSISYGIYFTIRKILYMFAVIVLTKKKGYGGV